MGIYDCMDILLWRLLEASFLVFGSGSVVTSLLVLSRTRKTGDSFGGYGWSNHWTLEHQRSEEGSRPQNLEWSGRNWALITLCFFSNFSAITDYPMIGWSPEVDRTELLNSFGSGNPDYQQSEANSGVWGLAPKKNRIGQLEYIKARKQAPTLRVYVTRILILILIIILITPPFPNLTFLKALSWGKPWRV